MMQDESNEIQYCTIGRILLSSLSFSSATAANVSLSPTLVLLSLLELFDFMSFLASGLYAKIYALQTTNVLNLWSEPDTQDLQVLLL
jgi:hypothetical protein